ncbi:AraC family transcriptional regulator [Amaricoccus sp. W119]|uniref:AraC family transcriptional regulator n=1 Tax=Amaricoccus sp. W119 TaxID=3391833 RepID=UPI0039A50451
MEDDPPPSIPSLRFDSGALAPSDRLEAWRAAIASVHDTRPHDSLSPEAVAVRTTVWNLGPVVAAHGGYSALRAERTQKVIRRSGAAGYKLHLSVSGGVVGVEAGERRQLVRPGGLIVTDLSRAGGQRSEEASETIVLYLSRPEVEALLPGAPDLHGRAVGGPLAALLRDQMTGLVRALAAPDAPAAAAAPALARATLQLFAAALSGAVPAGGEGRGAVEDALRRRITAYVEAHLLDPDLSQERLCRAFHMSRATLYRVMQPLGGVAAYAQARRLARIHAELLDPTRHHHLGRLAEEHGFASQSHMSRAYKARYGLSPSETGGGAAGLPPPGPVNDERLAYERWLRSLGG